MPVADLPYNHICRVITITDAMGKGKDLWYSVYWSILVARQQMLVPEEIILFSKVLFVSQDSRKCNM